MGMNRFEISKFSMLFLVAIVRVWTMVTVPGSSDKSKILRLEASFLDTKEKESLISCGSSLISDRFILTAAHCEEQFSNRGQSGSIIIRPGTEHAESIKVKRTFKHPYYRFPKNYNDIAISELSRRVLFDKYGDSLSCLGGSELLTGKQAIIQRFGATEENKESKGLLQVNVRIISNKQCAQMLKHNISNAPVWKQSTDFALPYGVIEQLLCTVGVPDEKTGNYSVSLSSIMLR